MNIERQVLVVVLCLILSFAYLRGFLFGLKRYRLNISAYNKRRKGESFAEWFLYTRYRDVIPQFFYVFYCCVIGLHITAILFCLFLHTCCIKSIGRYIAVGIVLIDAIWLVTLALLFWNNGDGYAYKRWIKKAKEKKKARRK